MAATAATEKKSRNWNIALWFAQIILAGMFLMAGLMKLTSAIADLSETMPWVVDFPVWVVRFIGICEFLGALGLILPAVLRVRPMLTAYAALGLLAIMVLAMIYHVSKGQYNAILFNLLLGGVAAFIAWGRLRKVPLPSKRLVPGRSTPASGSGGVPPSTHSGAEPPSAA